MSINTTVLSGNLTKDPELRYTPNGLAVLDGTIANNRQWRRDNGELAKETCFIDWVAFGPQAEYYAERIFKGSHVTIEGQLKQDTWEKEGQKRSKHKITVREIIFPYPKKETTDDSSQQTQQQPQTAAADNAGNQSDDAAPF
jgi:single-strand DNA-binding protein